MYTRVSQLQPTVGIFMLNIDLILVFFFIKTPGFKNGKFEVNVSVMCVL